jgi:hypothetical protein
MEGWNGSRQSNESDVGTPPENPLLAVIAATVPFNGAASENGQDTDQSQSPGFETWVACNLGREVLRRIAENRHNASLDLSAAYFDTIDDVQQKALIWLWQTWQADPEFSEFGREATSLSHQAGILTKIAVWNARCMYAKRRREGRESQVDLLFEDGVENPAITLASVDTIQATDIHEHDRRVLHTDKRADVQSAIELVTQRMIAQYSIAEGNHRRIPIEHITRTIIEGHMYHYTDRYNQTGNFRQFCEGRGVSKNQIAKWRPIIFDYLREELHTYKPVAAGVKVKSWSGAVLKVRRPIPLSGVGAKGLSSNILRLRTP